MTSLINASSSSGNNRRIKLLSTDLIFGGIDNFFVYPSLDVNRLQDAISRTLSFWPILTGRVFIENDDDYFIQFSDESIPFTYCENDQLEQWPNLPVIVDDASILQPFIDSIQFKPEVEPLLRLKVTRLVRSNEYVLGTSFSHMVGDADSNIHFLNDLSQIYQELEIILPRPIFERHPLNSEDAQFTSSSILKLYQNVDTRTAVLARLTKEHTATDPLNMSFSSEQIARLHQLSGGFQAAITPHDALCAYIILLLNKHVFQTEDKCIRRTYIYANYRNVTESLTSKGYVANAIIQPLSDDFPDPFSLSSIAQTVRQLLKTIRQEEFLQKCVTSINILMKKFIKNGEINFVWEKDEVIFNSNYRYDWANQVNFGMKDQCRFHTMGLFQFYFRIFQLNPMKDNHGHWIKDNGGAEIAFRIPKGEIKEKFLAAWQKDIVENFVNVK
ncbi:hypothetical protein I4U23_015345 [Adineta vaga]|nr:hypothetical protein I4U23_015345 [Adineta vaga]